MYATTPRVASPSRRLVRDSVCALHAGVEGESVNFTLLTVFFIARGYATWLSRKLEMPTASLRVSVGTDSRISALAMRCAPAPATLCLRRQQAGRLSFCAPRTGHQSCYLIRL